jgi:probable HAF family extracellular repeat protein
MILWAVLTVPAPSSAQNQPDRNRVHYVVFSLGTPLGGTASLASGINNLGWVAGASNLPGDATEHAELWAYGLRLDLGTLGGPNSAVLWPGENDRGQIVGISDTSSTDPLGEQWSCGAFFPASHSGHTCLGFLWNWGVMSPLQPLGGNNSFATEVNNQGQVVGWAETPYHDPTCNPPQVLQFEAVIWGSAKGQVQPLSPLAGDPDSAATALNDRGQVVGISGICQNAVGGLSAKHAVLWQNGTVMRIGDLGGAGWNTPMDINNRGQVVGFSDLPGDNNAESPNFHAFFWSQSTGIRDLNTLPGGVLSEALAINDEGQVVGVSFDASGNQRAFLWQNGAMTDLNNLIPSNSPYVLQAAQDINEFGEITGQLCNKPCSATGPSIAFLAIPTGDDGKAVGMRQANGAFQKLRLSDSARQQLQGLKDGGGAGSSSVAR